MKRFIPALSVTLLALLLFLLPACAEEGMHAASPTDLCAHEQTHEVYYFDAPVYQPLNEENHRVSGRAAVSVVCDRCGQELALRIENTEEICAHVFRKGQCVLCGWENAEPEPVQPAPQPAQETVLTLTPVEGDEDRYTCTLTGEDLSAAEDTLVLRPEGSETALALQTDELREEMDRSGSTITAEIESAGNQNVNASVCLNKSDGEKAAPEEHQVSLRIYGSAQEESLTVSYTDPEGNSQTEQAGWVRKEGEGYWNVPWRGNGNYDYGITDSH